MYVNYQSVKLYLLYFMVRDKRKQWIDSIEHHSVYMGFLRYLKIKLFCITTVFLGDGREFIYCYILESTQTHFPPSFLNERQSCAPMAPKANTLFPKSFHYINLINNFRFLYVPYTIDGFPDVMSDESYLGFKGPIL